MPDPTTIILIGGTSHAGKSTVAQALAAELGWSYRSTDKLARHPARPWATQPNVLPAHVVEHYRSLDVDALLADVLRHYRQNVAPLIRQIVATEERLVMEGSAILPELGAELRGARVAAVWLLTDEALITQRIRAGSRFDERTSDEQVLIDKFIARSIAYDRFVRDGVGRSGLPEQLVSDSDSPAQLVSALRRLLERSPSGARFA